MYTANLGALGSPSSHFLSGAASTKRPVALRRVATFRSACGDPNARLKAASTKRPVPSVRHGGPQVGMSLLFPGRGPRLFGSRGSFPSKGERAGIWVLLWLGANALTHRIHPDVPCNSVWHIVRAKNVVVEFLLPQVLVELSLVEKARSLFQNLDKPEEIAGRF